MQRPAGPTTRILTALALCAFTACSDTGEPPSAPPGGGLATQSATGASGGTGSQPAPATGDAVVRGTVLGVDSSGARAWSEGPLAGVAVTVIAVVKSGSAADSSTTPPTLTVVGTVTTGADGAFELAGVAAGYYYLDAVPPAGSPYRSGRAGSVSFPQGSSDRALVYLYR